LKKKKKEEGDGNKGDIKEEYGNRERAYTRNNKQIPIS
jgi:hypothetical protein